MGEYDKLKAYIEDYWPKLKVTNTLENKQRLGLPHAYYVPSSKPIAGFVFPYMFYWDNYFIAQGLWGTEREHDIIGLCENMFDLINRFGYVPNTTSFANMAHSQPPLLSSLVLQIYTKLKQGDNAWLSIAYDRLVEEYRTTWIGTLQPHIRMVHKGLSRYYDPSFLDVLAETESGWDYTTRFDDRCLDFLPIDLNCFLFKYEIDLAIIADILGSKAEALQWQKAAKQRKATVNELMWNEPQGMFFDYDFVNEQQGKVESSAALVALFSGLATDEQAEVLVKNLSKFEFDFGVSATGVEERATQNKQWTYPNGWAPIHDLLVDGLLRYGYEEEARRIAAKWVQTVNKHFVEEGKLFEKYNVVDVDQAPEKSVYPDQEGFGWTNAITYKFITFLDSRPSLK